MPYETRRMLNVAGVRTPPDRPFLGPARRHLLDIKWVREIEPAAFKDKYGHTWNQAVKAGPEKVVDWEPLPPGAKAAEEDEVDAEPTPDEEPAVETIPDEEYKELALESTGRGEWFVTVGGERYNESPLLKKDAEELLESLKEPQDPVSE